MRQHNNSDFTGYAPCPRCKEKGLDWDNDNLALYDDGHGYCFACGHYEPSPEKEGRSISEQSSTAPKKISPLIDEGDYKALKVRKLSAETCQKFGYSVGIHEGKTVQIAPYFNLKGQLIAQHLRFPDKQFKWRGNTETLQLFGQHLWKPGGRRIVITEGEIDCMTISQLQDNRWPVVSIPSGADSAVKYIRQNIEFLESFEEVVLAFDMDEPGREATTKCAPLFSPGKCRVAHLPEKDANDCMLSGKTKELLGSLWDAQPYRPDGILNGKELYARCMEPVPDGLSTPYLRLDEKTLGIHPKTIVLFTAGSGIGKSTIVNEIAYHLHQEHKQPLGVIALEESPARNGLRYIGIHTNTPLHLPGRSLPQEEYDKAFEETIGRGDWWIYEHFGSTDIDGLIAKIRYLIVGCGVRVLVLDHISIVVSGLDEKEGESERKIIDKLMTRLRSLVEETGITVLAVVHLKRPDKGPAYNEGRRVSLSDLRGSGSLEQLSDVVIALERDQQGDEQNLARVRILKNRLNGVCGDGGELEYHEDTGRLLPCDRGDAEGYGFGDEENKEETLDKPEKPEF